jgi:hypothetical protein
MSDEPVTCVICHEAMEPYHQIVKPKRCSHTFHAICIHIWLTHHRSCPLCRRRISISQQLPWRALFAAALVISQETVLERASYTYAFLHQILKTYQTKQDWKRSRDAILAAAEQFELGMVRLPFLDLTTRTTAIREKRRWRQTFEQLSEESVRTSIRIQSARRQLLNYQFGGPHIFETTHTTEP